MHRILLFMLVLQGCDAEIREVVLHRENCAVCHRPLNKDSLPEGIEDAHPWYELSCSDCHGGNGWICDGELILSEGDPRCEGAWIYDQVLAHVDPAGSPKFLKDLSPEELDDVDRDYLRFINPGDLRVVKDTCGRCHTSESARVKRSMMAHAAGELGGARYRSGKQASSLGILGASDTTDPNVTPGDLCTQAVVNRFSPPPLDPGSVDPLNAPTVANAQEQFLAKQCLGCHVSSFGSNDAPGLYRSSGCSACHMPYANHGLSSSKDPWVNKQTKAHPIMHRMVTQPPTEVCTHCHHAGARIGLSFQGIRERILPLAPHAATLGTPMYGKESDRFIQDENIQNSFDETPPDVHFQAGMHCVDCHTKIEVHGDNHIQGLAACVTRVQCEDCHGSPRARANPSPAYDHIRESDGEFILTTRVTQRELAIPQVIDAITPGHPRFSAAAAVGMGVNDQGFSHVDKLACQSCHSGWVPTCYGCHVEVDLARSQPYKTTGVQVPGAAVGSGIWHQLNDLVLMKNAYGRYSPSMPAERLFFTLVHRPPGGDVKVTFDRHPRRFTNAEGAPVAGFGQRPIDPHTTVRRSQFMACDRCHSIGTSQSPPNEPLLDITHGFGSERFPFEACPVGDTCTDDVGRITYQLDAVLQKNGESLIVSDPASVFSGAPLTMDEIEAMRAVVLDGSEGPSTPIPAGARSDPSFPASRPPWK